MSHFASFRPALLTAVSLALLVWACDGSSVVSPLDTEPKLPEAHPAPISAFVCQANPKALSLKCNSAPDPVSSAISYTLGIDWSSSAPSEAIIFGGQHVNVDVISSNITNDQGLNRFGFDVSVKNLRPQPIGTTNGVTTDSSLSIFFHSGPTTTGGSGTITVFNPTGIGSFTGGGQPYFNYPEILVQNATSANKNWILQYDEGVATFSFILFISANVKYPFGYIDVYPATGGTVLAGSTLQMTDSVRDALGVVTGDQSETWSLSDSSKASIDASGLLTGVSAGTVVVTATQGLKTGSASVAVTGSAPSAVADSSASNSAPGVAYHTAFNTAYNPSAPGLLSNDIVGSPAATIASFGGGTLGGSVTTNSAGSTVSLGGGGSLTVNADGSISFTPNTGATGYVTFSYRLTNALGSSDGLVKIAVGARPSSSNSSYTPHLLGNVKINTATSTNTKVTASGDALTYNFVSNTNGTATIHADGTYEFKPNVGYTGAASFVFNVSNGFGASANSTVSLTVDAPRIWFVADSASGTGDGRYGSPLKCLVGATNCLSGVATATSDVIHVAAGTYANSGAMTLLASQRLIGEGAGGNFADAANANVTWPADAGTQPGTAGARPRLNSAGSNVLVLGSGNTIRGIISGNTAGGASIVGAAVGSLSVGNAAIVNASGGAFHVTTSGALSVSVDSIVATGGSVQGIVLTSTTGTFSSTLTKISGVPTQGILLAGSSAVVGLGSGSIQAGTDAVSATGGSSGSLTFGGSISGSARPVLIANAGPGACPNATFSGIVKGASNGILVQNCTSGTVLFSGPDTLSTGANKAVQLATNTGATINFTGGALAITTTTGNGFEASGGGTVNVTGAANTISSGTGTALSVQNTTIGASHVTFQSISASGGANGIVLTSTGSTGHLTVAGNGGTCNGAGATCTGGTIQNTTGAGILLNSTNSPSFDRMKILNTTRSGVEGIAVVNFAFTNGTISGNGTGAGIACAEESNIDFYDYGSGGCAVGANTVSGVVTITGNTLLNALYHGVDISNGVGTISDLNISNNTFTSIASITQSKGSAVRVIAGNGAGTNVGHVTKATLSNNVITNFPTGAGFVLQANSPTTAVTFGTAGSATNIIAVTGNLMDGGVLGVGNQPDRFITAAINGLGQGNFNFSGNGTAPNPIAHIDGVVIELSAFGPSNVTATVSNNRIAANNAVGSSGLAIGCDADSWAGTADNGSLAVTVSGNNVSLTDGPGIFVLARGSDCSTIAKITNNTVAAPNTTTAARAGIRVDAGSATGDVTVCLEISGNTTGGSTNTGTGTTSPGINLRKQGTDPNINVFGIEGMAATSSPGVENFVNGLNTSTSGTFGVGGTALLSATSGFTNCNAP